MMKGKCQNAMLRQNDREEFSIHQENESKEGILGSYWQLEINLRMKSGTQSQRNKLPIL